MIPRIPYPQRHATLAAAAALILVGSRFAVSSIVAHRLSQTEFGQFAYVLWLVDIAFLACSLGSTGTVARYAAEFKDTARLGPFMTRWRLWAMGLPFAAGLAVVLGTHHSRLGLDQITLVVVSIWAMGQARWSMQTAALMGSQRFDKVLLANLVAAAVMITGVAFVPEAPFGLLLMFGAMASSSWCAAFIGSSYVRRLGGAPGAGREIGPLEWRSIRAYALNIWLTSLLWALVWSRGEFPVVRAYVGNEGVASYAAAMVLFGGAMQAVMLGVASVAPELTRLWGEGRVQDAIDTARRVTSLQLLACGVASLLLICFGSELMRLAFGDKYRGGAEMLTILGPALVAMTLASQNHVLQIATNARFNRDTSLLGLLLLMLLAFTLTPLLGLSGAALARACTMGAIAAVSVIVVRRRWGRAAVPLQAILTASSICLATAVAAYALGEEHAVGRAALFVAALAALGLTLKAGDGRLLLFREAGSKAVAGRRLSVDRTFSRRNGD